MAPRSLICLATALLALSVSTSFVRAEEQASLSHLNARKAPDWLASSVVYEIFPRQFSPTGDFAGITAKLDSLKDLGVDVLWLMPIHPIGEVKKKGTIGSPYAVRDYYGINPNYGTAADLKRLVAEAHKRGQRVIIDIVANHTSWDNVMMANPAYYARDAAGNVISPYDWTDVAELNYEEPATRTYMREMLKYWIREYDLDGFRCDVAGEVPTSFWEEVRADLEAIKPDIFLLAEANKPDLLVKAFDADYAWPMLGTLNMVMTQGLPATAIRQTWERDEQGKFPKGSLHLRCSDNHDEPRAISRFGLRGALVASALMFTLDGVPLLYNGMEVGDTTESGAPALFEKLPVFWFPKDRNHFLDTYRSLIKLRRESPALQRGSVAWIENSSPDCVVSLLRRHEGEEALLVANLSSRPVGVRITIEKPGSFTLALGSSQDPIGPASAPNLEGFEWRIYRR
ncbi:MAG: alpha-amylase family glycosyl hydrolase [Opitutaceae bacterium]|nr:alpha-amylase family glycosyl hydrolase [Opitutaceae bacterium]